MKTIPIANLTRADLTGAVATVQIGTDIDIYYRTDALPRLSQPEDKTVSVDGFRDRFKKTEIKAWLTEAFGGDAKLQYLLFMVLSSGGITLDDTDTVAALDILVAKGILTEARKTKILSL
jgi:hypothetical protein